MPRSSLFEDAPDDLADAMVKLDRRMKELEQTFNDPTIPIGSIPTIFPDGITIGVTPVNEDVLEVTSLTISTDVFLNDVMAFFVWPDPGDSAVDFEVEYAVKTGPGLYEDPNILRTAGTEVQASGLRFNTTYGARIWSLNRIGRRSDPYPAVGFQDFTTGIDTTIPAVLTGLVASRGATTIVLKVNEATDVDVADGKGLYEYQIDTVNTFVSAALKSKKDSSFIVAFNDITAPLAWYARARAIDEFGNEGPWTAAVGPTTAGGVIDAMVVADLSAAKIVVGVMSGDRIDVNTLSAATIKTSSLTTADITLTGGSLKAGTPPTTGLLINSQGLRLYSGGVLKVTLDVAGTASFSGNISSSSLTSTTISGGSITSASLISNTISGGTISSVTLSSNTITSNTLSSNTISGGSITSTSISSTTITGGTITSASLSSGSISSASIIGGTIFSTSISSSTYTNGDLRLVSNQIENASNTNTRISWASSSQISIQAFGGIQLTGGVSFSSPIASALFLGVFFTTPFVAANAVINTGNGEVGVSSSTRRIKKDIDDLATRHDSSSIFKLTPKVWRSRQPRDDPNRWGLGFIAEEVHDIDPILAGHDLEGLPSSIDWPAMTAMMFSELKKLRLEVDQLKNN